MRSNDQTKDYLVALLSIMEWCGAVHSKAAINGSQWLILHSGEKRQVAQFDYLITAIAVVAHSTEVVAAAALFSSCFAVCLPK